jgi:bacterioferritin
MRLKMTHPTNDTADKVAVIKSLNETLAKETVCVLRYKRHNFMAKGIHSESVNTEFSAHAKKATTHADPIAKRITELGYAG